MKKIKLTLAFEQYGNMNFAQVITSKRTVEEAWEEFIKQHDPEVAKDWMLLENTYTFVGAIKDHVKWTSNPLRKRTPEELKQLEDETDREESNE